MTDFGTTPLSDTTIGTNQLPTSAVFVPGTAGGALTAMQGGPASTDGNGFKSAPGSYYASDGNDVAQGATTDTAVTSDANGTISAKLRGLVKILASVWDSVHGRLIVDGSQVTQPANVSQVGGSALALGQATMANSVPVTLASNQTYPLPAGSPAFVIKEVKNVSITAGAPVSIWTPASGKKFRLVGANLYPTGTATSAIFLEDATGSSNEFLRFPRLNSANTAPTPINLWPNGYLSSAANNQLFIDVSVSCGVEGFVWGDEE